jgi:hypothetical protein
MERRRGIPGSGPVRALIVVCLLAGMFAMHGLTGHHDAAMALTHRVTTTAAGTDTTAVTGAVAMLPRSYQAVLKPALSAAEHHTAAHLPVASADFTQPVSTGTPISQNAVISGGVVVEAARDGHRHSMGEVCLAILVALVVAVIAALGLRNLCLTRPVAPLMPALGPITAGRSPPWLHPRLSKLCVLRT